MEIVCKHRPRNEHLNMKIQIFRDYVTHGEVTILNIGTLDQVFNYLTREVNQSTLGRNRFTVQVW